MSKELQFIFVKPEDTVYVNAIYRILKRCGIALLKKGYFHWIPFYSKQAIRRDCSGKCVVLVKDLVSDMYTSTFQMSQMEDERLYLRKLATDPLFEGQGIAKENLVYVEAFARDHHCSKIRLDVYIRSKKVIALYEKVGFVVVGTKRSIRFKELIMEKTIV